MLPLGEPCRATNSTSSCVAERTCDGRSRVCSAGTPLVSGTRCDDGRACTDDDRCDGQGLCVGGRFLCECELDIDCVKADVPCQDFACLDGKCVASATDDQGGACDDGNECTINEVNIE